MVLSTAGFDPIAIVSRFQPDQVALGGIVTLVVIWLLAGRLVPRSVLLDRMKDKDDQIALAVKERDAWHTAHTVSEQGREELKRQNGELIRGQEIANRFLDTARSTIERPTPTEDSPT